MARLKGIEAKVSENAPDDGASPCPSGELAHQLADYRLTTAEILYHMPDHPRLLQTYVWQDYDIAPRFPVLQRFLSFWERNLDGRLHSVTVASQQLIRPSEFRFAGCLERIH